MNRRPSLLVALVVGVVHAAAVYLVALSLGYPVGPGEYTFPGLLWRYGGLAVAGVVPAYLLARYRVLAPALLLAAVAGVVLYAELTPPGPTFERYGGYVVVEDGLYAVTYAEAWYAWTAAFLYAGVAEYAARSYVAVLPDPSVAVGRPLPLDRASALAVAGGLGLVHALAMVPYAFAVEVSNLTPPVVAWIALGAVVVGGAVGYLAVRHRLLAPAVLFVANLLLVLRADFQALPDGPAAVYLVGWVVFLGVFLLAGGVEYGLRIAGRRMGPGGPTLA